MKLKVNLKYVQHLKLLNSSQLSSKVLSIFVKLPSGMATLHLNLLWIHKEKPFTKESISSAFSFVFYAAQMLNAQCTEIEKISIENRSSNHLQNGNSGTKEIQFAIEILKKFFIVMLRATGHGASFNLFKLKILLYIMNKKFQFDFFRKVLCPQKLLSIDIKLMNIKILILNLQIYIHRIITMEIWWVSNWGYFI